MDVSKSKEKVKKAEKVEKRHKYPKDKINQYISKKSKEANEKYDKQTDFNEKTLLNLIKLLQKN